MVWATALIYPFAASASVAVSFQAVPVGLGPYTLAMTVAEAKAVPIKGLLDDKQYQLVCTDQDRGAASLSKSEAASGLMKCRAGYRDVSPYNGMDFGYKYNLIYFGSMALEPTLEFHSGRLVRITVSPFFHYFQVYTDALRAKYGAPSKVSERPAQTVAGAQVTITNMVWNAGDSRILLDAPALSRDQMLVVYSLVRETEAIDAAVRAADAKDAGI